jgi:hypothetical protein
MDREARYGERVLMADSSAIIASAPTHERRTMVRDVSVVDSHRTTRFVPSAVLQDAKKDIARGRKS